MKKIKRILCAALAAMLFGCFLAFAGCAGDAGTAEFDVPASFTAEQGTVFTFPSVKAEKDGRLETARITVKDSGGGSIDVFDNSFYVAGENDYTATFTAFGESVTRTVYVSATSRPDIWLQCNTVIPAQIGRPYVFDTSKVVATEGSTLTYAITTADGERVDTTADESGNLLFTPQDETYTVQIVAAKNGMTVSETLTVYGVNRSDNVIADFEYQSDIQYVQSNVTFPIAYELSANYAHSGRSSLRVHNLHGSIYPRIELIPGGNITVDPDATYTMTFWYRFDNPDKLPVGLNLSTVNGNRRPDLILTGAPETQDGQWHKVEHDLKGSEVHQFGIYMFNWQEPTGVAVDPRISLYIDDIYLAPQIEGDSIYYVAQQAGGAFDVSQMTGSLNLGGHNVPNTGFRVTKEVDGTETEVEIKDGKLPLDEVAVWRLYPENITGDVAYVVRVRDDLTEDVTPYAICDIPEDAQNFDLGGAFRYRQGSGLSRDWQAGINPFTLTFKSETKFDLSGGGSLLFDMAHDEVNQAYTVVVTATLSDGTEVSVYDVAEPDGGNEFNIDPAKVRTLAFDLPADSRLQGAKLTFALYLGGSEQGALDQWGNVIVRNFRVVPLG